MSAILLVHGGDEHARRVFREEGRADWSQALRVVLEKHGYLDLQEAGPDALSDPERLRRHAAVLVARLPDTAWSEEAVAAITAGDISVLVEGPLPAALDTAVGVSSVGLIEEEGAIAVVHPGMRTTAAEFGAALGAALSMPTRTKVDRDPALDWDRWPSVPISAKQADAWRARGWEVARWALKGRGTVLCDWLSRRDSQDRCPAIVRSGALTGCSFGLFAFLTQRHTCEPYDGPEWRATDRCIGLEAVLLGLVDEMHRRSNAVRARVLPWPQGATWSRTVRYDVDHAPDDSDLDDLLRAHTAAGHRTTWFWPPSAGEAPVRLAAADEHEIALSAERLWATGSSEAAAGAHANSNGRLTGVTSRASSTCFRYQGAPNVLWAERERFGYTDLLGRSHLHPHRFPSLGADGTIRILDVICLPHPEGIDYLARDDKRLQATTALWRGVGGALQLTRQLHDAGDRSFKALTDMGGSQHLDWTAGEVANWWRKTHDSRQLSLRSLGDGEFEIRSAQPLSGMVLELLHPDGTRTERRVDLDREPVRIVEEAEVRNVPVSWDETDARYLRAIRRYSVTQGMASSEEARLSLENNTRTVPARGELLIGLLDQLAGRDLKDATVLDVGCGFGNVACYLAWRAKPRLVIASDVDQRLLDTGAEIAHEIGLDANVQFVCADMRSLAAINDASIDVVLANGVLMYMTSRKDLARALQEFSRVLVPGGHLLVYHGNKWSWRDPATGRALPHLRDRDAAKRWLSPPTLSRQLRKAHFHQLQLVGFSSKKRHDAGLSRYVSGYYAMTAVRDHKGASIAETDDPRALRAPSPLPVTTWEEICAVWRDELQDFYRESAIDSHALDSTLRTNTTLVPQRGDTLLTCLADLGGTPSITDMRVLEMGCGFGALAAYLAWKGMPRELVAADIDPKYLELMNRCVNRLKIGDRLRVVQADMRDLSQFEDESFDVVVANNSFIYLVTAHDARTALKEFRRVLAPGGVILFYHANRWRWTEPFTGDPIIHLLPARAASALAHMTGWRHNHGRVRLVSPPRLRLALRRAGFETLTTEGFGRQRHRRGIRRNFGTFYALAARRR